MSTTHLLHGWSEQDGGAGTVMRYAPYIAERGIAVQGLPHQWPRSRMWALVRRHRETERQARKLAARLQGGDCLVTFSNGGNIAYRAVETAGAEIALWVAIAPALPHDSAPPESVRRMIVMHSDGDTAVRMGAAWTRINPAAWFRPAESRWGSMGRYGYTGDDERVENWAGRRGLGHLGWFDDEPTEYWAPKVAEAIAAYS